MDERPRAMTEDEVAAGLAALPAWSGDTGAIQRSVQAPTFLAAVHLVTEIAAVAEEMDHHPDIDIRWRTVRLALSTHDAGAGSPCWTWSRRDASTGWPQRSEGGRDATRFAERRVGRGRP